MKKLLALLTACGLMLLAAAPALADAQITAEVVGEQMSGYSTLQILRIEVQDGARQIPPVYALTESTMLLGEGNIATLEDVNFDGHDDLVVMTVQGASNACYTFYLWDEQAGAFQWFGGADLWNYVLYPNQRAVLSQGTSGWAGLLHEAEVYAWSEDGKELHLVRSSVWDTLKETEYEEQNGHSILTERLDDSVIVETYFDAESGESFTESAPADRYMNDDAFALERFAFEQEFLSLETEPLPQNDGSNG